MFFVSATTTKFQWKLIQQRKKSIKRHKKCVDPEPHQCLNFVMLQIFLDVHGSRYADLSIHIFNIPFFSLIQGLIPLKLVLIQNTHEANWSVALNSDISYGKHVFAKRWDKELKAIYHLLLNTFFFGYSNWPRCSHWWEKGRTKNRIQVGRNATLFNGQRLHSHGIRWDFAFSIWILKR